MLMAALRAGGMRTYRNEKRDLLNVVPGEKRYVPNRLGLFESTTQEMRVPGWPRQHEGSVVKAVTSFLGLVAVHDYRVVFMRRDPEEIRQSYRAAFGVDSSSERVERECAEALRTLTNRKDVRDVQILHYRDVLSDPITTIGSLGWPVAADLAATVIDPAQYRFRRERLTVGL